MGQLIVELTINEQEKVRLGIQSVDFSTATAIGADSLQLIEVDHRKDKYRGKARKYSLKLKVY